MDLLGTLLAGTASLGSPCVLPLIPVVLALAAGMACLRRRSVAGAARWGAMVAAMAGAGFSIIFAAEGATASAVAAVARGARPLLQGVTGALLLAAGAALIAGRLRRLPAAVVLGAAVVGGAGLAAAWTPCVGPVLATALFQASIPETLHRGVVLLAVYAAGLFLPLVPLGAAAGALPRVVRREHDGRGWSERFVGVVLVAAGVLLVSGRLATLTARLSAFPSWLDIGA